MGESSFRVFKMGGGYWRVLYRIWQFRFLNIGPYRTLSRQLSIGEPRHMLMTDR